MFNYYHAAAQTGLDGKTAALALELAGDSQTLADAAPDFLDDIARKISDLRTGSLRPDTIVRRLAKTFRPEARQKAEEVAEDAARRGITIIEYSSEQYPATLRAIYDPPAVLYVLGDLRAADAVAFGIVGARKSSYYALKMAEKLSRELAAIGVTVISGAARGCDSAAHKGALAAGGRTIGVVANGLDRVFPPENAQLYRELRASGAVITENPVGTLPLRKLFPARNRIISGLSLGVLVVEAAERSGSLITARLALEQGREVFALPHQADNTYAQGGLRLLRQGAKLVVDVDDIVEDFEAFVQLRENTRAAAAGPDTPQPENEREKLLISFLSSQPVHFDTLAEKAKMRTSELMQLLTGMELKALVKRMPGNFIVRA